MKNFKISDINETMIYTVDLIDDWTDSPETRYMTGAALKSFTNAAAHLYDIHATERKKPFTIHEIKSLTETQAAALALEIFHFKGHKLYFVDFGGYFGFSVLVFAEGHHIEYANDYELHHKGKTREELRTLYLSALEKKLFTESELRSVSDYEDYRAKEYYIRNYYGMRRDHISMFFCGSDAERAKLKSKTKTMVFSPVFMAYYDKSDADFVSHGAELIDVLETAKEQSDSPQYWQGAFLYEMFNHEYAINWQGDFDVCSCFGDCSGVRDYTDRNKLFDACRFTDTQRGAYLAARREYMAKSADMY